MQIKITIDNLVLVNYDLKCSGTKCLKNKPCDVIKMREIRGEMGKKTPNKRDG